jgi:glutaredoxin
MNRPRTPLPAHAALLGACVIALASPAWGQAVYRSVGPDGRVTFSDRPPEGREASRVQPSAGSAAGAGTALPTALRRVAERFPVVLYAAPDCAPCDEGRRMLVGRGIPYSEASVTSAEDIAALERLAGERTLPLLGIGGQLLRGWSSAQWTQYLDVAGYPARSALPNGWAAAPPAPLAPRRSPPQADVSASPNPAVAAPPPPAPSRAPQEGPTPSNPAGIRF